MTRMARVRMVNNNNRNNNNNDVLNCFACATKEATADQSQQQQQCPLVERRRRRRPQQQHHQRVMPLVTICSRVQLQHATPVAVLHRRLPVVHHRRPPPLVICSSSAFPSSRRQSPLPNPPIMRLVSLLVLFTIGCPTLGGVTATARLRRTLLPLGMDKQMFPPQNFDENAPICTAEREPCGFYSFSLDGKAPLKWIKSWCRCSGQHECVYERTDMRMRVYRQTCIALDDLLPDSTDDNADVGGAVVMRNNNNDASELHQLQSVVLVETVPSPSSTVADRDDDDEKRHPQRTHRHHHHHHNSNHQQHHYRSTNRHHRHNVVTTGTTASRHSRKTHRQRQVIRRLQETVLGTID